MHCNKIEIMFHILQCAAAAKQQIEWETWEIKKNHRSPFNGFPNSRKIFIGIVCEHKFKMRIAEKRNKQIMWMHRWENMREFFCCVCLKNFNLNSHKSDDFLLFGSHDFLHYNTFWFLYGKILALGKKKFTLLFSISFFLKLY